MLVETQKISLAPDHDKGGKRKENNCTGKEQVLRNRENKLQWWSHSRNWFLRALCTWHRLTLLSYHRSWIPKVH